MYQPIVQPAVSPPIVRFVDECHQPPSFITREFGAVAIGQVLEGADAVVRSESRNVGQTIEAGLRQTPVVRGFTQPANGGEMAVWPDVVPVDRCRPDASASLRGGRRSVPARASDRPRPMRSPRSPRAGRSLVLPSARNGRRSSADRKRHERFHVRTCSTGPVASMPAASRAGVAHSVRAATPPISAKSGRLGSRASACGHGSRSAGSTASTSTR